MISTVANFVPFVWCQFFSVVWVSIIHRFKRSTRWCAFVIKSYSRIHGELSAFEIDYIIGCTELEHISIVFHSHFEFITTPVERCVGFSFTVRWYLFEESGTTCSSDGKNQSEYRFDCNELPVWKWIKSVFCFPIDSRIAIGCTMCEARTPSSNIFDRSILSTCIFIVVITI